MTISREQSRQMQIKAALEAYGDALPPDYMVVTYELELAAMRHALDAADRAAWHLVSEAPRDGTQILLRQGDEMERGGARRNTRWQPNNETEFPARTSPRARNGACATRLHPARCACPI